MRTTFFAAPFFVAAALVACGAQPMSTAEADTATSQEALLSPATGSLIIPIALDQTNARCVSGGGAAQIDVCGANGVCHTAKFSCFPYHCDGTSKTCATACAATGDCAKGFTCQSGACVMAPPTQCVDATTSRNNLTGATASCWPYVCDAPTGTCLRTCIASSECSDTVCDINSRSCVAAPR